MTKLDVYLCTYDPYNDKKQPGGDDPNTPGIKKKNGEGPPQKALGRDGIPPPRGAAWDTIRLLLKINRVQRVCHRLDRWYGAVGAFGAERQRSPLLFH